MAVWPKSAIFSPPIISPVMINHAINFPSKVVSCARRTLATGRTIIILHVGYRLNHSHSLHNIWSVCSSR